MALGNGSVIVSGARTPIGKLLGGLAELSAAELGGIAIKAALERAGALGDDVAKMTLASIVRQAGLERKPR